MKPTLSVEIKKNDFQKKAKAYPGKVSRIVRKTAFDILITGNANAPIETGFLRNSASVSISGTVAAVYWAAFYAMYQEFGTRYIAPVLFATGAVNHHRQPFIDAIKSLDV